LVAHEEITGTITRLIEANKLPHLLFYGPPGTGKTSTILAIAKKLYGDSYSNMTLELNASDDRGIGVVRDQIKSFASTRKLFSSGVKLIILDEADALTKDAQVRRRGGVLAFVRARRLPALALLFASVRAVAERRARARPGVRPASAHPPLPPSLPSPPPRPCAARSRAPCRALAIAPPRPRCAA
jgi:SpoVK/Ycf46/Vps4 family AAA+-type ATPase